MHGIDFAPYKGATIFRSVYFISVHVITYVQTNNLSCYLEFNFFMILKIKIAKFFNTS
jgi:hypothetical protein